MTWPCAFACACASVYVCVRLVRCSHERSRAVFAVFQIHHARALAGVWLSNTSIGDRNGVGRTVCFCRTGTATVTERALFSKFLVPLIIKQKIRLPIGLCCKHARKQASSHLTAAWVKSDLTFRSVCLAQLILQSFLLVAIPTVVCFEAA